MSNIKYTYWLYYLKECYEDDIPLVLSDSLLYAYTDSKDFSKLFEKTRNMSKFIRVKKELSRKDLNQLAKIENEQYLINRKLSGQIEDGSILNTPMIMTKRESAYVEMKLITTFYNLGSHLDYIPMSVFTQDTKKLLKIFQYQEFQKITSGDDVFSSGFLRRNFITYNELGVFVDSFHKILQ